MRIVFAVLSLVALTFSLAFAEIDPHAYPSEFEFDVYEYYTATLDVLVNLGERNAQEQVIIMATEKFKISTKDLEAIQDKFSALESALLERDPGYEKGKLITYRWKKIKELIDEIGWQEILQAVGQ